MKQEGPLKFPFSHLADLYTTLGKCEADWSDVSTQLRMQETLSTVCWKNANFSVKKSND